MTEAIAKTKHINPGDDHPPSRPGVKTSIVAVILLIGGATLYW